MNRHRNKDVGEEKQSLVIDVEEIKDEDRLPVWRKVCFAIGGAPYQMTNTVINFFLSIFLLEVAKIPPLYVSVIVFSGKAWDAVTDPMIGILVSRTNTRFGKLRPWILFSTPFGCAAYFFMWYVPDFSDEGKLAYYFVFYCLFQGFLTCLHVPYTSLTMYITGSQKERDSATAYRMVSEAIGVLLASLVQGQLINEYRIAGDCKDDKATASPTQLENQKLSYIYGSAVMIGIYLVCSITTFFGTREKQGIATDDSESFCTGLKLVLGCKSYVCLSFAFLFISLAIAVVQGNLALFTTHTLNLGDYFTTFMVILLATSICSIPIWQKILVRFGKKSTYAAGIILFIPTLLSQLYITDNIYVYYAILVLAGFSVAVSLLLPWSMLPDVLDEFMLKTGQRKDAIFYSFYVFFNKLAAGLALGISQVVLEIGGYQTGECRQPSSVGLALRLLIVPGPVIFCLIALIFLWMYPIDEDRRKQIRSLIAEKKKKPAGPQKKQQSPPPPDEAFLTSASYNTIDEFSTEC
ncbi:Major facilitator superfamily domain-containing protein 2A-A [Mizuhopecten yessoensis]|uniref:Major facilitator superfamily domain-containing protein 2A-A n=1 Tax=Mizuhopecten yessoensis TaxID=6573 RepID=A0A210PEF0_MIZYE|nr:Major facilitator superfamily domain-containing protein 2A-A [Mizuhopecten yessoensis]